MEDRRSPLGDFAEFPPKFVEGLLRFREHDWVSADACFRAAERRAGPDDGKQNLYASYHGLTRIYLNDPSGLNLCRRAAAEELFVAGVFANLAHAELRMNHRRRAYEAVCRGLKIDANHLGLRNLRHRMGVRRSPLVSFLHRDHIVNRVLGKLTYRGAARRRQPFRGGVV